MPLARKMRAQRDASLVLFAGDTMAPSLWSSQFRGMQMVAAHNAIGVDFASLGNHDFDFGIDGFLNVSNASNFTWLNANVFEASTGALLRGTKPNAVRSFYKRRGSKSASPHSHKTDDASSDAPAPFKVGIFGVMYNMNATQLGLYWEDPIEAAKRQVQYLRGECGVDFVIAMTHQFIADDNKFVSEVKGVDLILGGHDHALMLQSNYGTPYLKSEFDFRRVWKSHVEFFRAGGKFTTPATRMKHEAVAITQEMETDDALDAKIAAFKQEIAVRFNVKVGSLCAPLDLTELTVRTRGCPVGDVFADSALEFYAGSNFEVDAAVMNGGGIRTNRVVPAVALTLGELMAWSPFGNLVVAVETDGASLRKYIAKETLASCGAGVVEKNGYFVHPAGFKYAFQCSGSKQGSVTALQWLDHPTRSGDIADDEPLTLALSNFLFTSEFSTIPEVTVGKLVVSEVEAGRADAALEKYVRAQPNGDLCPSTASAPRAVVSF